MRERDHASTLRWFAAQIVGLCVKAICVNKGGVDEAQKELAIPAVLE
jgi:hypothetical protein